MKSGIPILKFALKFTLAFAGLCAICVSAVGCKAGPAKSAGFVDPSRMTADKSLPFHKVWKKPDFSFAPYNKIYIAPVDTTHMLAQTDWQKGDRKDKFVADVEFIARYAQTAVKKSFREDPKHHFEVVDSPPREPNALIFNISLVEIVPSKVVLNALGYAPFFIGTGITAVRAIAQDNSTVAFEARLVDASNGQTVVMLADREAEQMAVASVRGLTWYSHAQSIISQWGSQFVQMTNQKSGEIIKDSDAFTLQPW